MVVLSQPALEDFSPIKTCKANPAGLLKNDIPVIDLRDPKAKAQIVEACEDMGFFKVVNHGVSMELMSNLESEALKFFKLPQSEKDRAGPPNPFGYGNKRIGPNGDVGWIEYLLFSTNPDFISHKSLSISHQNHEIFRCAVNEFITAVREMVCSVLEMIGDELKIEPRNALSRLLRDSKSDSFFRLNHYPPCQAVRVSGRNVVGFGEHTDPQIMSAVRSNNTTGLQISLPDGAWLPVPPDPHSFFINVGDSLQVMTNGRFKSVRHRVLADSFKSRVSMIYFGGPPLGEKITPLPSLMEEGEESLYKEFTWCEYKKSAYKSRLGDNRLGLFEKNGGN